MAAGNSQPLLRLGLIGLGGATSQMLPSLLNHPHTCITACAEPRREPREKFAADFAVAAFEDARALCESPEVDAVYIASPHQWHRQHAIMAAEAGKHIIIEKPMALNLSDCDAIIDAVERHGIYSVVGHTHSFDAPIMKMREIIRRGDLGTLAMINNWNYGNFIYRPRRPEELRSDMGGGIIYNQVPHQVDMVRLLGGGMVRSVRSMAWVLDPDRPTEGSHVTFLQFDEGSAATLVFSGYDYFDSDEFHFWIGEVGEEKPPGGHGSARRVLRKLGGQDAETALKSAQGYGKPPQLGKASTPGRHHPHFGVTIVSCTGGDMRPSADGVLLYRENGCLEVPLPAGPAFPDKSGVINELYDAVAQGREPLRNARWGKATMEVSAAILTSARERREITLSHQVPLRDGQA